ncbi:MULTISPECIES: endonuclease MutS2 [Empedobacter]|uniref:DNA mismatch repair protein MutS n=1 Tax=Empedobacter falsenii TaxID=343874 RepID=A0A7H9DUQ8_9FLAO|nr:MULTISPECIES: DNA mismatch repair protein MutS [Empedobacter]MDH2207937.1 DNA mismatch repair protein MutS [Empedobacter sp. GD03644]QLL58471.1 DNA mismatch repair protein MutS [Empedobacter falsenii]
MQISEQTLKDLEFNAVQKEIAEFAYTEKVEAFIFNLKPYQDHQLLVQDLQTTNEYLTSFETGNRFPFSEYYILDENLSRLEIENYYLPAEEFFKIKANTLQVKEILKYLTAFNEYAPVLFEKASTITYEKNIVKLIDQVFNKFGEIKDDASPELKIVRDRLRHLNGRITELFNKSMSYHSDYLDDIRESVVGNRRVLAVKSALRKRVKGQFLGTSKTGSITFIEPESVQNPRREWEELKEEEKHLVIQILLDLTAQIAEYKPKLEEYQTFLEYIDFTQAKANYAFLINGILPQLSENRIIKLVDAYHPVLFLNNKRKAQKTIPQSLEINEDCRIIIISGPNAGGKSITLKTIGLLQIMIQSGVLVPVKDESQFGFFNQIFTDIGDNQSIENHLSTYSYRLKQMSYFLKNADDKTLLLVDEFGTGSDPELGGALAEVFFEEFYERNSFGVFTTHYTNIKLSAESLPEAINACMLFDKKTLEPLYRLEIGQAGSSFTFEVAEKNKIPFRLINRAKKKVESEKVSLDKTILKLQQEKFEIQKTKDHVEELRETNIEHNEKLEQTNEKIQQKLYDFQQLYDREQKRLKLGERISDMADSYLKTKNKKQMISNFLKLIEMENSKKTKEVQQLKKIEKIVEKEVKRELKENSETISQQKHVIEKKEKAATQKKIDALKVGDRVKIHGSSSVGTIDKIKKEIVFVNYGLFTTQINVNEVYKI